MKRFISVLLAIIAFISPFTFSHEAHAYSTMGSTTIEFPESLGMAKSRTITIPHLYRVTNIRVDNGTVSYTINGDQLTVNVNNGNWINREEFWDEYKYSRYQTAYRESSVNSFSSTYYYNSGGYSGTLYANGSSYVARGYPPDTKTVRIVKTDSGGPCPDDGSICKTKQQSGMYPTQSYNQDGYTGTLYEVEYIYDSWPAYNSKGERIGYNWSRYQVMEGTVSRPDTRVYRQDYSGYVYQPGWNYRNHTYAYKVDIEFMRNLPPELTLEVGLDQQRITDYPGYDEIRIAGYVQDPDNDTVQVTVDIEGVKKTINVSNTLSSAPFEVVFKLSELNLDNGIYPVKVSAFDGKNGHDNDSFNITIRDSVFDETYILVDNWVQFLYSIEDIEGDPIIKEQFKFVHNPDYFEYADRKVGDPGVTRDSPYEQRESGGISDNGEWRDTPYERFTQIGHYEIYARVKDNPKDDPNFEEFQKWSKETVPLNLYVHRKPVADIEPYMTYDGKVTIIDRSLDFDSYSQGERGIKEKTWWYRQKGSSTWTSGKPETLNINREYEIRLRVLDFQGEYNETIEPVELVHVIPNLPPEPGFTHKKSDEQIEREGQTPPNSLTYYVNDYITIISTAYDPDNDPIDITFRIESPSGKVITEVFRDIINYNDVSFTFHADEVGRYKVTQIVDDRNHPAVEFIDYITINDLVISGKVSHTENWKKVHEELGNEEHQFFSGEKFLLEALVTEYPIEEVTVSFVGLQIDGDELKLEEVLTAEPHPIYKGTLYDPAMSSPKTRLANGEVHFLFKAKWKNGTVRTDLVTVEIIDSVYAPYQFHRTN